jgi:photosystem II stability/assembly factor-like uncharacterized protein
MDASHFDANTAYAAVNRIRCDDMHPHIYKTNDGGKTWKEIVNGLPNDPINVVKKIQFAKDYYLQEVKEQCMFHLMMELTGKVCD